MKDKASKETIYWLQRELELTEDLKKRRWILAGKYFRSSFDHEYLVCPVFAQCLTAVSTWCLMVSDWCLTVSAHCLLVVCPMSEQLCLLNVWSAQCLISSMSAKCCQMSTKCLLNACQISTKCLFYVFRMSVQCRGAIGGKTSKTLGLTLILKNRTRQRWGL